jgi:hypothetical protein
LNAVHSLHARSASSHSRISSPQASFGNGPQDLIMSDPQLSDTLAGLLGGTSTPEDTTTDGLATSLPAIAA